MNETSNAIDYWDAEEEETFLSAEKGFIEHHLKREPKNAVALSGGGIRSATFSLGALQALSRAGVLKRMDYISTVSGGGYLGGSLQWWWNGPNESKETFDASGTRFPYGIKDPQENATMALTSAEEPAKPSHQDKILDYLRSHGNYLTPGRGIGVWSGVGILTRAIVLNLILWLTMATALLWVVRKVGDPVGAFILGIFRADWFIGLLTSLMKNDSQEMPASFALLLGAAIIIALLFIVFSIIYSVSTYKSRRKRSHIEERSYKVAFEELGKFWNKISSKYGQRRIYESVYQISHPFFYGLLAIGIIPLLHAYAVTKNPGLQGLIMTGAGVASGLWGYFKSMSKSAPTIAKAVALPVGSLLFLYGVSILAYQIALYALDPAKYGFGDYASIIYVAFGGTFLLSLVMMFRVNINYISPHRFYRDRIMEAFMPAWSTVDINSSGWSPLADKLRLSAAWPGQSKQVTTPFPLINTNVVLVNQKPRSKLEGTGKNVRHRRFRLRGGDNFVLTPFASGSLATGWRMSGKFMEDSVTLASAVAISGAAANPDAAYLGNGHTRNRFVSTVMRLFNLRLGYWVVNPRYDKGKRRSVNHFRPGLLYAITSRGHKSKRPIVELTDGGHFDNLGVYELIRRRAKIVIVCDGEADKETSYSAFVSLARRVEEDFDVKFEFRENRGPELLVEDIPMLYPSGAKSSEWGFFVAKIHYKKTAEIGAVIYLKATMIGEVSLKTKGYKGAHPDFPDETTADQFFDEEQFEAYRELGYAIAKSAVAHLGLENNDLSDPKRFVEDVWQKEELIKLEVGKTASKTELSSDTSN